jgi:branched-chain amino acid transport system permease protein
MIHYLLHLVVYFQIFILVALSLNILIGYGGLLQVAHAAYFGVGAYAAALVSRDLGLGFFSSLGVAAVSAGALSLAVALPAWRFRGDYFLLVSLAVQVALYSVMYNWIELTGGSRGLIGIPAPAIGGSRIDTLGGYVALYAVIAGAICGGLAFLKLGPFGLALKAFRDDEVAARSLGIPVRRLKVQAFVIASGVVGVAGGMYAAYVNYVDPSSFSLDQSILMLSMVIVGGTGNVLGPIVGAGVLIALPEILRLFPLPDAFAANVQLLVYGLLLIGLMHWRPQGLAGTYTFE